MKKTLILSLALSLAQAASLRAATVEVFLTGSTAFRANVYTAATKLFTGGSPTIYYGDAAHGGANAPTTSLSGVASWVMTGNPITQLTNIQGNTLIVHGLFTGSVQGMQTVQQQTPLVFAAPVGTPGSGGNATAYVTNTPTIGFSDSSSAAGQTPVSGNYVEESVAVQPFVMCVTSNLLNKISNVSLEQLVYGIPNGRIPLSSWSSKASDLNNFVYLVQRTKDSGTRRVETALASYAINETVGVYIWDSTNKFWYLPTDTQVYANGAYPHGIVGAAGLNNVNAGFGAGYVGGGDVRDKALADGVSTTNQSMSFLSFADARTLGASNWANVVSFNGFWPTAAGANVRGNTGTNDLTPITLGYYPCWGEEVLVYGLDQSLILDSKITSFQLGTQTTPGSVLGVFNSQTKINGGSPIIGSIENEIELSKSGSPGATAIRLSDMKCNRSAVGGIISPF